MHKFTIPGLLTLSLIFFSSAGMAGNPADCSVLKDPEHELYNPTVYGLCVAWHNADENGRVGIGEKFLKRAGFAVPGSKITDAQVPEQDFYCPCWDDVTFADICALGEPSAAFVNDGVSGYLYFSDGTLYEDLMSNTGDSSCMHRIQQHGAETPDVYVAWDNLSADDSLDCQAELEAIVYERALMCSP